MRPACPTIHPHISGRHQPVPAAYYCISAVTCVGCRPKYATPREHRRRLITAALPLLLPCRASIGGSSFLWPVSSGVLGGSPRERMAPGWGKLVRRSGGPGWRSQKGPESERPLAGALRRLHPGLSSGNLAAARGYSTWISIRSPTLRAAINGPALALASIYMAVETVPIQPFFSPKQPSRCAALLPASPTLWR